MIPTNDSTPISVNDITMPSYTWRIDYESDYQIRAYTDNVRAMEQAIFKILNTERYKTLIYDWNYGIEIADLFGQPIPFIYAELQRRIEEALLADDRIKKVYNFSFSNVDDEVTATFDCDTTEGTFRNVKRTVSGIV